MTSSLPWAKTTLGWLISKTKIIAIKSWKILIEIYKLMVITSDNFVSGMPFENHNMSLWITCIFWSHVHDPMETSDLIREKTILKNPLKNRHVQQDTTNHKYLLVSMDNIPRMQVHGCLKYLQWKWSQYYGELTI